ncbi:MAG: ABC transporter ATP-binding protein [Lachnospiraceae bacterium]|nr:ABC transporter ATP-binding protein [Lachnospiraceae bacterium]
MKQKQENLRSVLRSVIRSSPGVSLTLLAVIILSVITALLPPLVLERSINLLTEGHPIPLYMALLYLGTIALSGIFESGQNVWITVFGQKVTHGLRSALCQKLHRLPASYFITHESGSITSRFVSDVDTVDSLFTDGIVGMFADVCKVISIIGVIFYKSPGLGIVMLIVTPLLFLLTRMFQKRMLSAQLRNRKAVAKVNNHVPETIRNIRMIHVFLRERYMEDLYDQYITESFRATDESNAYDAVYSPIIVFTGSCVVGIMMVCAARGGSWQAFFGISVGTAVAIISYVSKVFEPLEAIGMEIQNIQSAVAGVKRINEFLSEEERSIPEESASILSENENTARSKEPSGSAGAAGSDTPAVTFENVSFAYLEDKNVLDHVSFAIKRNENRTLVGRTGAGKSTIFRLILGLYEPKQGAVRIYERDASQIPDSRKRKLFGYVEQQFHAAEGSVADQISLFDEAVSDADIKKAAKLVGLHDTILSLPQGYDTPIEKASFSMGQCQLLSIARAVAASPEIMLLDEITANLDSETEHEVLSALERASSGRTVISITHRTPDGADPESYIRIG